MNKIFFFFLILIFVLYDLGIKAQVVWSDDFSSGSGWTLNQSGTLYLPSSTPTNGTNPNSWIINNDYNNTNNYPESSTIGGSGGNFLHITCTDFLCTFLLGAPGPVFLNSAGNPAYNTNRTAVLTNAIPGATLTGGPFTFSFNWLCKGEMTGPNPGVGATLIYSINGGPWQEYPTVFKGVTSWQTFSISLSTLGHVSGQSFRFGFRWFNDDNPDVEDPPMMVDDIKITQIMTNTITTSPLSSTNLCQTEIFDVNFTSTGTFNPGNVYSVELSDATGSFASPTVIGTLNSTANSGTISCTVPGGATPGTGYRVRVVSSNPAVIGSDNGVNITIQPFYNPTVTINASPGTTICAGENVSFTSSVTGLPFTPAYQWQINTGMGFTNITGATSSTYSTNSLNNGDIIRLRINFSGPCNSGFVFSNTLTFTIASSVTPSVNIVASANPICAGQSVTFTATPTNGGSSPSYQWQLNGNNITGATGSTYTTTTLNNGDQIRVVMTSNANCASPTTVNSNIITMTVNPTVTPSVNIVASANPICAGQSVTFTATPTNGGSSPSYQWQLNGNNITGATGSTYTTTTLNNGDQIRVVMTSNANCASPTTVNSNIITMTVNPTVTPSVNIVASANPICAGQSVTFTATPTNGGSSPSYQWQLNGNNITGATGSTYTTTTLNNGDQIRVVMTSNANCASPTTVNSNIITMTVNPTVTPSVNIVASANPICAGQSVTFTATPTNGGSSPSYQWQLNGNNITGATGSTYTTTTLNNGDQIRVVMTSNANCASPTTVNSNIITMTVNPTVTPSVNIVVSANPICAGQSVTFTATPTNGGSSPSYQWQLNGNNITGATGSTYTTTTLNNGDQIRVVMTSNANCASPTTVNSNIITMTVNPTVTPSVNIVASANPICAGQSVTFTATPTNGGSSPSYQWQLNGNNITGATGSTYTTTTLNNGDQIRVVMTSNANCASPTTVNSNIITMTVNPTVTPSVNIVASANPICAGQSVTFTATPTNGGSSPSYQWQLNGNNITGATGSTYTTTTLNNGDQIRVVMTSNANCASPTTVNSNIITMTVNPTVTPSVNIVASANPICAGQSVTFTATPTNGGSSPSYQWQLNGNNITGATGSTYTTTTLNNGDQIRVVMTSNANCASPTTVNSNIITMTVNPTVTPSVNIVASANPICAGQSVTFTATPTNGGSSPSYQWQLNGNNITGATGSTYTTTTLNNGDQIRVVMTSNANCASPTTVNSNIITMTVNPTVTPSVNIVASANPICAGQSVTFTATPTNGGSSPSYQWQLNGNNITGATGSTYTTTTLNNGDQIRVVMTSNANCASPTTVNSNIITMTVNPTVTPSVNIVASANPICAGQSVTFTATPTNGGSSPSYQWQLNGNNITGATGSTYTTTTLNNGDQIRVVMTSNANCASPTTVNSNIITMTVSSPTVVSPNVSVSPGTSICAGQAITFTELNNYPPATATYQWNVNGNAVTGATSNIFTTTTLNNGDQVTVTITPGCGTAVTSNAITITVSPNTTASVSISANPGTTVCQGTSVTFTATPTNGGASPSYSWTVNGNAVGTNSPTYTTNTLQNGDVVQVTMQSSIPCTNSATSQVTMTVNTPLPVSVNISASTGTNICAGQSVTFTATPTNGGANPTYQWQLNGNNIPGATGSTYTTTTLNNNDVINVVMTSSLSCVSGNPAFSNNIQFTVNTPVTPGVVISANPNTPVCQGTNITFTATPSNVINPPSYQWYINGNPVSGATSSTFSTTSLNNGDVVTVELTSNDACVTQSTVTSNAINAQINSPLPVSVNVTASNNSVCSGTNVQFTANVNNGGTPTYQWQVNGVNQGTNSPIFDYVPSNGDVITVIVTSSLSCVSNNPATSNAITMTVNPNPTVSCSGTNATFGNPNTFTATATGAAPITYVFDFGDGNQITTNNSSVNHTYSTTGSFNYVVTITDGNGCTASCNGSVNVTNPPIPVANFTTQNNIWAGCSPLTINFVNTSQNANTWEWNFGDGSPNSNALNPTHTFVNPGVYNMYLAVQNNFGLDTAFATIIVYPNPTAGIKVLTVNPNIFEPTQFQDNSSGAAAWEWDFGDPASGANNFSTDQNPSHQYTSGGTYTVKLVVTNAFGCKDSITKQVSISTVSIEQPAEINDLVVYPNPFSDKLEIRFHSTSTEQVQLIIYDGIGKQVSDIQHNTVIGDNHIIWNVEEFALGVYHLVIHQGEKMSSLRLVRTR